jgi:hypothetical protein
MSRGTRFALAACALLGALAVSSSALAAYTPRLVVKHAPHSVAARTTTISIQVPREDDATAKVTFYAALGYRGVLGQAAGTQLGTVQATVQARAISPDAILPLSGVIRTDNPANYTTNTCAPGAHRAVWLLVLEAAGRTLNVPVYIDVPEGPEANFSTFKFQVCLPSPFVPEAQGGAAFGAKLLMATLTLQNGVIAAPTTAGRYVWPAFFSPYTTGAATVNAAGTVQARSVVQLGGRATLVARYVARTNTFRLSGSVLEFRIGVGGARVQIFKGLTTRRLRRVSNTTTRANGRWQTAGKLRPKRRTYFRVRAVVPDRLISARGCALALPDLPTVPGGCVTAVYSGFTVQSRIISLRV